MLCEPGQPVLGPKTDVGHHVGTPRYMSPEQIQEDALTPASDLYSLGIVAYELLVGNPAIKAVSTLEIYAALLSPQSTTLPQELPIPRGLRAIIDRMMLKNPRDRYQSADEVQRDLAKWMSTSGVEFDSLQGSDFQASVSSHSQAKVLKPSKKIARKVETFAPVMLVDEEEHVVSAEVSAAAEDVVREVGPTLYVEAQRSSEPPHAVMPSWLPWVIVLALVVLVVLVALILAMVMSR